MDASNVTSEQNTLRPARVPALGLARPYSRSPASFVARCSAAVPAESPTAYFTPTISAMFFSASYTGIEKYCIMAHCYGTGDPKLKADPKKLFRTLASSTIMLFGGNINV
jgi:hypothetical protein